MILASGEVILNLKEDILRLKTRCKDEILIHQNLPLQGHSMAIYTTKS